MKLLCLVDTSDRTKEEGPTTFSALFGLEEGKALIDVEIGEWTDGMEHELFADFEPEDAFALADDLWQKAWCAGCLSPESEDPEIISQARKSLEPRDCD